MKKRIVVMMIALAIIAGAAFAQTEADFTVGLTEDGTGVVIKKYLGKEMQVRIPAAIEGMPVRVIEDQAFRWTRITAVVIPASVTTIGGRAFGDCTALTAISIPESVTSIGREAFSGSGLVSFIWPASDLVIPEGIFYGCKNLKTVTIPEGVTAIGKSAFSGCTALTEIKLPSTIQKIGGSAFSECRSLVTVSIPDSVGTIEFGVLYYDSGYAFESCPRLSLASQAALKKRGYKEGRF